MDTAGYSKWDDRLEDVSGGHWGRLGRRFLFLALALVVTTLLWALILSILLSKASTHYKALLSRQELLRKNASKHTVVLDALTEEVGTCNNCCVSTQALLKTASSDLAKAQVKLLEQESALKDLKESVTQSLAEARRDRENIRSELFRELETVRLGNSSCEQCPTSWLPFRGSCYLFSEKRDSWEESQRHCTAVGAHLVIINNLDEQVFLAHHTGDRGFWLGLRAVRRASEIQHYQWVDGGKLDFSYWNTGEPNDSRGLEDCVMMLHTGLWNDAPCSSKEKDNWICEKRQSC